MAIETPHAYAIATAGFFIALLLLRVRSHFKAWIGFAHRMTLQHLVYPRLIRRHRFLGPWSRADVLAWMLFVAANTFCLAFGASSLGDAGRRAARLSLVNLIPAYGGPHLSFLADFFGVSLRIFRLIHRSAGMMALPLLAFHVATAMITHTPFPLRVAGNMWGLVGASVLCCLLLLSLPPFRRLSYEVFLRLHQALAVVCAYATWRHLEPEAVFPRLVISVLAITFASMLLVQSARLLYHNKAMGAGLSRAQIVRSGGAVRIRLHLSRHIKVEAGQYIGLWIPAIGFWSSLQSHPFTVVTWSEGKQKHLDLLVQRRGGWTRKLSELRSAGDESLGSKEQGEAEEGEEDVIFEGVPSYLALFTGPHGISAPAGDYETVVMIASGFGIASQLPYLKQLLYGYNAHKSRNRRIHLVWQIDKEDKISLVKRQLDAALRDDTRDEGYILGISIYIPHGSRYEDKLGRRAYIYSGSEPSWENIIQEERRRTYVKRVQKEVNEPEDIAVLVSATGKIRDKIRDLVRGSVEGRVTLFELEYQPVDCLPVLRK